MTSHRLLLVVVGMASTLTIRHAAAQNPASAEATNDVLTEARAVVQRGQARFKANDYDGAVKLFRKAENMLDEAELTEPTLYFVLGRSYDQLGQIMAAGGYFRKFTAQADRGAPGAETMLKRADQALARIAAQIERTSLTFEIEPDGAEVRVDRREVGKSPVEPLRVTPGPHQITVWAEGYEGSDVSVEVQPGSEVPVVVRLVPIYKEPEPVVVVQSDNTTWWLIGGGAAVVVAGLMAVVALTPGEPEKQYKIRTTMQGL